MIGLNKKHRLLIAIICLVLVGFATAEETYNLEILFRCTAWDSYPDLSYFGIALAGGDVNGDGYSDIAVEATHNIGLYFGIDVYVFFGGPAMDSVYDVVLHCPEHQGHSPSGLWIGDVNADSVDDVVVGDWGAAGGDGDAWVFFGGSPLDTVADIHLIGQSDEYFGYAVAGGDVNGDGCDDIIVGAYAYEGLNLDGRVYVFYGGALLDSIPDVIINGHDNEAFGKSVGSGGDLNRDGYEDLVVGADENHEAYWGAGKVYVFFGGNPMDTIPDCWLHGEGVNHFLGWFGCDIMEVRNDYDMMITGTSMYPNGFPSYNPGKVYILYGGDPMDTLPDLWMIGQGDTCSLGRRSRSAGDINGDGYEDAVVGAPHDCDFYGTGYVWLGGMPMDTVVDAYLRGEFGGQNIGWYVASAGDVDGDGCDDMIFSCYAGMEPAVWVCKYTGTAVVEHEPSTISPLIQVKPNPFVNEFNIILPNECLGESIAIDVYDICGREVMSYVVERSEQLHIIVDTRNLAQGVYFISVSCNETQVGYKAVKVK
jgi:hypothetical protein